MMFKLASVVNQRIIPVAISTMLSSAAWAEEHSLSIPDFSGPWAREFIGFEPPESGGGPVANMSRLPTGQANFNLPAADYTDPRFTPQAAATAKRRGDISLTGHNFPQP